MLQIILTVLIIYTNKCCCVSVRPKIECGYKQCPPTKDGALNVHLIPHSHMDAGWVKTFDEYYFGTSTSISTANVQLIYHSVLSELLHDKRRKFTFSETAYFWRWWKEQRPATRASFRSLVLEGRVEFAGGGWVQNDEPTAHYAHIIDQYTWGLRKLNDTLGPCGKPKASWQIDTYGHSREQTSLLAQMGYDGLFIGRVDHKEREAMIEEDRMEFMWRGSDVLGKMSDIMTHTLFNLYNAPEGFCFDFLCNDEPIVDDADSHVYNADKRVNEFIAQIERQAKYYDHDNIMVTMGGDFTYQSAANWFMNMDKLINHVNTHTGNLSDVNIFYSTPSCYLKAIYLYGRRDKAIYTEKGDHLPYGSDASTYWTGYYTSRPSFKYFIRKAYVFLQVVKQLTVIARMGDSYELHQLRHAANLVLHHDAITGTSQQHVTNDFIKMLSAAVEACTKKVSQLLSYLTPTWGGTRRSKNSQQFIVCHQLNMSQCRFTETEESILLIVYNPLSIKTYHHVRLPAIALHYSIRDWNDEEVEYQLVPLPAAVINLPGRSSTVIQELCFEAENIPPLGYATYFISPVRYQLEENDFIKKHEKEKIMETDKNEVIPNITNEYLKVTLNKETGLLESVQHVDGVRIELSQNFYFYSQTQQTQQSGAYCFRPEHSRPTAVTEKVKYDVVRGALVKEIRQRFTDWVTQVIRLYRGEEFVEFEWIIGPVPIGTDLGKEVVTIFKSNVSNNGQFYTDSNGRQMMKRTCWNETASQQQKKPIPACYYPVTSRMCLQSANSSVGLCVLPDRPQGGTSYVEGEIELMVHRRLLTDDGFGLEESLNEEEWGVGLVVRGRHRIIFGNLKQEIDDLTFSERVALSARKWHLEPWLFMTAADKVTRRKWQNVRNKRYSALRVHGLPRHLHVLTLEPWKGGAVLLRLENTLEKPLRGRLRSEKTEGPEDFVNKPSHITVQLRQLFQNLKIRRVRETTLAGNQWLEDARQMDWSTRYVYQGADDDILAEDNVDYQDDSKQKDEQDEDKDYKEAGNFSEEEQGNRPRVLLKNKKINKRIKQRKQYHENYRQKRSVNTTENVFENTINGSFSEKLNEKYVNSKNNTLDVTTETFNTTTANNDTTTKIEVETDTKIIDNTVEITTEYFKEIQNFGMVQKRRQNLFKSRGRSRVLVDADKSAEEGTSSEEDLMKKRSPRKGRNETVRNKYTKKGGEIARDLRDDGVTKSMFEMYYKTNSKGMGRFTELQQDSKEIQFKIKRKRSKIRRYKSNAEFRKKERLSDYEDRSPREELTSGEEKRNIPSRKMKNKRDKSFKKDIPFFITDGEKRIVEKNRRFEEDSGEERRRRELEDEREAIHTRSEDYDGATVDVEDDERERDNEEMEEGRSERKKRTPLDPTGTPTVEQTEPPDEPDYIITLRPTQIRTFVIYFENTRPSHAV